MISLKITFFNINSIYEDGADSENLENFEDSPKNILEEFLKNNILLDFEKETISIFETRYRFIYRINDNSSAKCEFIILSDLSRQQNIIIDSDAYIIFFEINENKKIEKIDLISNYIYEFCEEKVYSYFIGINEDTLIDNHKKDKMDHYLSQKKIKYFYKEILIYNNNSKNLKINKDDVFYEILSSIIEDICYAKNNDITPKFNKFIEKELGKEYSSCNIF